jgi:hypothetical protein
MHTFDPHQPSTWHTPDLEKTYGGFVGAGYVPVTKTLPVEQGHYDVTQLGTDWEAGSSGFGDESMQGVARSTLRAFVHPSDVSTDPNTGAASLRRGAKVHVYGEVRHSKERFIKSMAHAYIGRA